MRNSPEKQTKKAQKGKNAKKVLPDSGEELKEALPASSEAESSSEADADNHLPHMEQAAPAAKGHSQEGSDGEDPPPRKEK